jgi:hypothetical protein
MGPSMSVCGIILHTITKMTLDATVTFAIPLIALLISLPVICHKEYLKNFNVSQTVHLFSMIAIFEKYTLDSNFFSN